MLVRDGSVDRTRWWVPEPEKLQWSSRPSWHWPTSRSPPPPSPRPPCPWPSRAPRPPRGGGAAWGPGPRRAAALGRRHTASSLWSRHWARAAALTGPQAVVPVDRFVAYLEEAEHAFPDDSPADLLSRIRNTYYSGFLVSQLLPDSRAHGHRDLHGNPRLGRAAHRDLAARADAHSAGKNPSPYVLLRSGEQVDIGHLFLGLDALLHPRTTVPFSAYGVPNIDAHRLRGPRPDGLGLDPQARRGRARPADLPPAAPPRPGRLLPDVGPRRRPARRRRRLRHARPVGAGRRPAPVGRPARLLPGPEGPAAGHALALAGVRVGQPPPPPAGRRGRRLGPRLVAGLGAAHRPLQQRLRGRGRGLAVGHPHPADLPSLAGDPLHADGVPGLGPPAPGGRVRHLVLGGLVARRQGRRGGRRAARRRG